METSTLPTPLAPTLLLTNTHKKRKKKYCTEATRRVTENTTFQRDSIILYLLSVWWYFLQSVIAFYVTGAYCELGKRIQIIFTVIIILPLIIVSILFVYRTDVILINV